MYLDSEQLHTDIIKKLNRIKKPQKYLKTKIKLSRSTLHRLSIGKPITVYTLFLIVEWLDKDINKYIRKRKKRI